MILRRLTLVFSLVICGSLALAAAAVAASGGLAPGEYTFASTSANAVFGGGKGGAAIGPPPAFFSVYVNRGLNSFQPQRNDGQNNVNDGDNNVIQSTMVQFTEFDPTGVGGFGCFIIPDRDFTVGKNLQSASLHTTLTAGNACPGVGKPLAGKDVAALGTGGGLPLPIKVDVTWSGVGVTSTTHDRFTYQCLDRTLNATSASRDSIGGSASGTTSALKGLFTTQSVDVSSSNSQLEISGELQPPCFGK